MTTSKKASMLAKLRDRAAPVPVDDHKSVLIPLEKIRFDKSQPRQAFHQPDGQVADSAKLSLEELAQSIEANGLIHPITVEPNADGTYRVVVGERRTRAYILLGRTAIEAKVRDDLSNPKKRLVYQVAENVNREDLTDADMASSIRSLMEGTADVEPMTQTQIAKELGKSQGWVSRYVKFGDEELQRLWMSTGIADTVEKLYRLSILPMNMQVEIQRRVQLPKHDPDYLAKPLLRSVIDTFASEAKEAKKATTLAPAKAEPQAEPQSSGAAREALAATEQKSGAEASAPASAQDGSPADQTDPVARAFAEIAAQGKGRGTAHTEAEKPAEQSTLSGPTYKLSDGDRESILVQAGVTLGTPTRKAPAPAQPPVSVRVPIASLQALLQKLEPEDLAAMVDMELNILLPGPLAERIANTLTGAMVDPSEVPAVVQTELAKLQ